MLGALTYPKKMNAFWKKMAIPGYTTSFPSKDNRFTCYKKVSFIRRHGTTFIKLRATADWTAQHLACFVQRECNKLMHHTPTLKMRLWNTPLNVTPQNQLLNTLCKFCFDVLGRQTGLTRHNEPSKQNPHGGNEGAESQHEAKEKPHSGTCKQR